MSATIFYPALTGIQSSGITLSNGLIYFYEPGTTTTRPVYLNVNKTTPAANPFTLDSNGMAEVFTDGTYDVVIKTAGGVVKYTWESYCATTPAFRGCLVYNNSAAVNGMAGWSSEVYDTDGIHSTTLNNDRLTVPAGVTKVRLIAQLYATAGVFFEAKILKNGAVYPGVCEMVSDTATTNVIQGMTPTLNVTAGDYFTVLVGPAALIIDANGTLAWFAMEIVD